jgi:hypothetical protein
MFPFLIPLLTSVAPGLISYLFGSAAGETTKQVVEVVRQVTGIDLRSADDADMALAAIKADPAVYAQLQTKLADIQATRDRAAADIIRAEAQSGNRLAASWRPIVMLTFTALIVARWLGFSAPGISDAEVLKLWDIVQLGLGGYVMGRSVEKIAPQIAQAVAAIGGAGGRR